MLPSKISGFYDFHITAEKAMDYFLQINYKPEDVTITKFDAALVDPLTQVSDGTKVNDHSIIHFFKDILSSIKSQAADVLEPNRAGYLITVTTNSPEAAELAKDALQHHGARFIHEH